MEIPRRSCDHFEQELADLERNVAALQRILDEEPDLGVSERTRLQQQIWQAGFDIRAVQKQLDQCLSDLYVIGVEYTQETQYFSATDQGTRLAPDNSVPLISGRPLILRAYIVSNLPESPIPLYLTGQLTVERILTDGSVRPVASLLRPLNVSIYARRATTIDRNEVAHTLNFRLNAQDCHGLLQFSLQVFEYRQVILSERLLHGEPGSIEAAQALTMPFEDTLSFIRTAPLSIRLVRIAYRNTARGFDLPAPTLADFWSAAEFVQRTFPVPSIELLRETVEVYDGDFTSFFASGGPGARGTTGTIFEILDRLRSREELPDYVHYVALIPGGGANRTGASGWSIRGRQISEVDGPVLAQELAHDSGFPGHAPCGGPQNVDMNYPTYSTIVDASIGEVGVDVVASTTYSPSLYHDMMSYCSYRAPGRWSKWISPYTYEKLVAHYRAAVISRVAAIPQETRTLDAVIVAFAVVDGQVANVDMSAGIMTTRPADGSRLPFTVQTLDDSGAVVNSVVARLEDPYQSVLDREIHLSVVVPLQVESRSICILNGGEKLWSAGLPAPSDPKLTIRVTKPTGTNDLTVNFKGPRQGSVDLDYSHDDGKSWQAVADNVTSGQHIIDSSMLAGGDRCRVRAVLSNGCRRYRCVSEAFRMPQKPLPVSVISPPSGSMLQEGETVQLLAAAIGAKNGRNLAGMNWSSSIDGFLGAGESLLVHTLSAGRHRITLAADDGVGGESVCHVFVRVMADSEREGD